MSVTLSECDVSVSVMIWPRNISVSCQVLYSQSVVDDYMWPRNVSMSPVKFCTVSQ